MRGHRRWLGLRLKRDYPRERSPRFAGPAMGLYRSKNPWCSKKSVKPNKLKKKRRCSFSKLADSAYSTKVCLGKIETWIVWGLLKSKPGAAKNCGSGFFYFLFLYVNHNRKPNSRALRTNPELFRASIYPRSMSHGAKIRSFSRWQEAQCEEWRKLLSHSRASWTRVAPGLSSKYPGRIFSTAESKYPSFNIKLLTTSRDKKPCFSCQE